MRLGPDSNWRSRDAAPLPYHLATEPCPSLSTEKGHPMYHGSLCYPNPMAVVLIVGTGIDTIPTIRYDCGYGVY